MTQTDAERLYTIIEGFEGTPPYRRLRIRLRELGKNQRDEVRQFRILQRACRESPELEGAIVEAGFSAPSGLSPLQLHKEGGVLVQAFNSVAEDHWER